uniref:arf-GAP with Rho-GAP domain, ANK repeat and PH domain-containing protein 1 n=1 Tax=Pristiophorus japonicus TaxID=55135 RepID=UPI00398EF4A6
MLCDEGEMSIWDLLGVIHLEQYTEHFTDNRYCHVSDCWGIRNEDLSRIGIFLPGHRKRILSALHKARQGLTPDLPTPDCPRPPTPDTPRQKPPTSDPPRPPIHDPARQRPLTPDAPHQRPPTLDPTRQRPLTPDTPHQRPPTPDLPRQRPLTPEAPPEKPVPKKRNVFPRNLGSLPALRPPPADKPLPPVPPRQSPGRPPERLVPSPRPRCPSKSSAKPPSPLRTRDPLPSAHGEGLKSWTSELPRRDLPVLPPRHEAPAATKPPPLPTRPLVRVVPSAPDPRKLRYFLAVAKRQVDNKQSDCLGSARGTGEQAEDFTAAGVRSCEESRSATSESRAEQTHTHNAHQGKLETASSNLSPTQRPTLDECRTEPKSPPPLAPRNKLSSQTHSVVDLPSKHLFDQPIYCTAPLGQSICETPPDTSTFFPIEMDDKDNICRTPCSDLADGERSSTGESPSSFFSDDDNVDDYEMMVGLSSARSFSDDLSRAGLRVDSSPHLVDGVYDGMGRSPSASRSPLSIELDTSQLCPLIKAGWLDKNPPQGLLRLNYFSTGNIFSSYIYQRRFVRLDADFLRYFENEKEVYSKRVISLKSITRVSCVGDQKFEVITSNRTFVFRAESDGERNDWVRLIQQTVEEKKEKWDLQAARMSDYFLRDSVSDLGEKYGYLEIRTARSKVFVSVRGGMVWLYKSEEDYRLGIGVTSVEMNVATVKEADRRGFDLTTPYKTFSFVADTEGEKEEWVEALRESTAEALSNYEVAEQIWAVESNTSCSDCGTPKPEWAAINLCLVMCKKCAGEHRALGPGISKVRSLKMDKKVWTEQMIQMFQCISNQKANLFWAANVPPSEAINESSSCQERKRFISAKFREGKYRKYHLLFGNQEELNKALCAAVVTSDLEETMSLVFCGADVSSFSGDPDLPTPIDLAQHAGQRLQVEFLNQNKNSETPRLDLGYMDKHYYVAPQSITHNGFLYKTASVSKPITDKKAKEEFSKRWCVLDNGVLSYYESDRNSSPNGTIEMREVVCLAVNSPVAHGFEHTFEVFTDSERLFMFGTDSAQSNKEWVKSIGKVTRSESRLLSYTCTPLSCAVGGTFTRCVEIIDDVTPPFPCLAEQSDHEVLVLVEKRRTLYIQAERKLDFLGWNSAIQRAAGSTGNTLSEQQLTDEDIPVLVERCVAYITQCGLTSEGIYRKSGQKSKTTNLLEMFVKNARSVKLREGEHQVDDVSNTLKRFFRESIGQSIFTNQANQDWLHTSMIPEEGQKILQYQRLFSNLPRVNRATLKALINHLYCVQRISDKNQMTTHNLAIVFGPTLFQTDGQDNKAGRVVEDLINHFIVLFNVDEQQLKKQLDEIVSIIKLRDACVMPSTQNAGDFICTVYLEEKKSDCELSLKVPATMTAQELTEEILYLRKLVTKDKDNWSCFEVIEREETERPLHYMEKVLPILHSLSTDSYLVVKKNIAMETMLMYLASKVADQKHGMVKFREERKLGLGLGTGSFCDRYFMLTSSMLRLYKEVRSNKAEREWPVKSLKIYLGVKKKFKPPTCWGFTIIYENKEKHEKQQWYLCCDTQMEQREWLATFLYVQHDGNVWSSNAKSSRSSRLPPDSRFANVSLIPLRGSANEMRNSVAAFSSDHLSVYKNV